jgi:hypothetical protein
LFLQVADQISRRVDLLCALGDGRLNEPLVAGIADLAPLGDEPGTGR